MGEIEQNPFLEPCSKHRFGVDTNIDRLNWNDVAIHVIREVFTDVKKAFLPRNIQNLSDIKGNIQDRFRSFCNIPSQQRRTLEPSEVSLYSGITIGHQQMSSQLRLPGKIVELDQIHQDRPPKIFSAKIISEIFHMKFIRLAMGQSATFVSGLWSKKCASPLRLLSS